MVGARGFGQLMTTVEERLKDLQVRVDRLETWAGPGQIEALSASLSALRAETAAFRQEFNRAFRDLRAEVAEFGLEYLCSRRTSRALGPT